MAFVDDQGRVLSPEAAIQVLLEDVCPLAQAPHGRAVVYDLKCSDRVREAIDERGAKPSMERSGHAFIKTRMLDEAGRVSGGKSAATISTASWTAATTACTRPCVWPRSWPALGRPLSEAVDALPVYSMTPDIRVPCESALARTLLERLADQAAVDHAIDRTDGVRVRSARAWGLLRTSVTEPMVTLRFEGHTRADLAAMLDRFAAWLPELAGAIRQADR